MNMSEEDIELRDLVAQTLEHSGLLSKIRAEIRASVFLAIEEHENFKENGQYVNKPLKTFVGTNEGSLAICLVREFLEFFELDFTLSVFDPETCKGKNYNYDGRSKLISDLKMDSINGKKVPLLLEILRLALAQNRYSEKKEDVGKKEARTEKPCTQDVLCESKSNLLIDLKSAIGKDLEVTDTKENSSSHLQQTKTPGNSQKIQQKAISTNTAGKTMQAKDIVLSTNFTDELSPRSLSSSDSEISSHNSNKNGPEKSKISENSVLVLSTRNASKNRSKADAQVLSSSVGLSSLSNLPPLFGIGSAPEPVSTTSLPSLNQVKNMHKIKAMIDLGLDSQDNYDEDFNSSVTGSGKEGPSNHGTDSEIEEELGFGEDDLLSSASGMEDMTVELSIGTITGAADYLEDVK